MRRKTVQSVRSTTSKRRRTTRISKSFASLSGREVGSVSNFMRQDCVKIEVEDEDEDKISYYNDVPDLKIQFNQEELESLREVFDEFSARCEEPDGKINFTFLF